MTVARAARTISEQDAHAIGVTGLKGGTARQETIVATETNVKATLHQRAIHELKEFVILAVYLYITLGAVIMMKTAVLHTEGIDFAPWGIAIVKAMLLAKFMLVGRAMKAVSGSRWLAARKGAVLGARRQGPGRRSAAAHCQPQGGLEGAARLS